MSTVLSLSDGSLSLEIAHKGLHIHRLLYSQSDASSWVEGAERKPTYDLVPTPEELEIEKRGFLHCVVGRYVNRLPAKEVELPSGTKVQPQTFPPSTPGVSLHGGPEAFDQRDWTPSDIGSATLFTPKEKTTLSTHLAGARSRLFTLESADGDGGYPGKLRVEVFLALLGLKQPARGVMVVYRAKLLDDTPETPINLTQHWGFNLDASDGVEHVRDHSLTLKSSNILTLDPKTSLPTGTLTSSLDGTAHDHRTGKTIGERYPAIGYDDFYLFDTPNDVPSQPTTFDAKLLDADSLADYVSAYATTRPPPDLEPVAVLSSARSGLRLEWTTNQAGVQLYTAPGGGGGTPKKVHHRTDKAAAVETYGNEFAAFLEFHAPYGGFIHPQLADVPGGKWDTLLQNGSVYNNVTRMTITTLDKADKLAWEEAQVSRW